MTLESHLSAIPTTKYLWLKASLKQLCAIFSRGLVVEWCRTFCLSIARTKTKLVYFSTRHIFVQKPHSPLSSEWWSTATTLISKLLWNKHVQVTINKVTNVSHKSNNGEMMVSRIKLGMYLAKEQRLTCLCITGAMS